MRSVAPMNVTNSPVFETRDLCRSYWQGSVKVDALSGVNMTVSAGQFLVIAGTSGSGKSTLLHLLGGLDRPDAGAVFFDGTDLASLTEAQRTAIRRRRLGFVFQSFNLVPVLSAYENVEYGLWLDGVPKSERRRRVEDALEAVGLADRMSHRPDHLSGGQRQRVALARALVHEPAAVLADEPTASLDSLTGRAMVALLTELNERRRTTFVFATHDPAIIARSPRVIYLTDGKVVEGPRGDAGR